MAGTNTFHPGGKTLGLSVAATSHAAVSLGLDKLTDFCAYAACINTGSTTVAIRFSKDQTAATLPSDGTLGDFVLPPTMTQPLSIPIPSDAAYVTAIGSAAGPSLVYVTPLVNIS